MVQAELGDASAPCARPSAHHRHAELLPRAAPAPPAVPLPGTASNHHPPPLVPSHSLTHSLTLSLRGAGAPSGPVYRAAAAAAAAAVAAVLLAPSLALSPPPAARLSRPSPSTPRACHGRRTWLGVPPHAPLQLPQVSRRADYTLAFSRFSGFELTLGGFSDCSEGHNPHLIPSNSSHYFII
jgi:hypothetical protein